MKTTIDMPDDLARRLKKAAVDRHTTARALLIDALERSLGESHGPFQLRDASVGESSASGYKVDNVRVNQEIDEQRQWGPFRK